jgi:sugar lactone lactonase YvrE
MLPGFSKRMRGSSTSAVTLLMLLAALAGCAAPPAVSPFGEGGRVWPESPNTPRIEFVREFSSLSDFGVKASFWDRIVQAAAGKEIDRMMRPMAAAMSVDGGTIYVADPDARCVHRYDLVRGRYTCLRSKEGSELASPIGLAVTEEGSLFVADSESGQIFRLLPGKKWLEAIDLQVDLKQPTGIAWDEVTQQLIVSDTGQQRVNVFSSTGRLISEFGERGSQAGQFNFPTYLWLNRMGEMLISDSLNFRVQIFDKDGTFLSAFGIAGDHAGDFARPKGIATDSHGHIYVVDALFHAMQIFNKDGDLLLTIGGQGQEQGQFWLPNGVFITKSNLIFVADTYNKRIQVFRYIGPKE